MKRRFFLKSAGGAVLAAPLLSSLNEPSARAQRAGIQRSVLFHSPNGCLTNRWFPKVEDGPLDAAALAGTTLEVLTPFASKLLVPRGLRGPNPAGHPQFFDPHVVAMASKLTCAQITPDGNHYATSHSLDHEIARQKNPGGADPLVLSVGLVSDSAYTVLSYSASQTPFLPIVDPRTVYAQLSGVALGSGTEDDYRVRRGNSIIDAVAEDLRSYQNLSMSLSDKDRIEAWLDLLRDSERSLLTTECGQVYGSISAEAVTEAGLGTTTEDQFTTKADMMMNLMALSMICDANRSLTLMFPHFVTFDFDGIHHEYDQDGLGHRTGSAAVGGACVEGVLGMLREIDEWYAMKFGKMLALFDGIPEGDGTLLDNTATLWIHELSDGNAMNLNNMPIVVAGSAGGYLKQGAVVNVEGSALGTGNSEASCGPDGDGTVGFNTGSTTGNVPMNKLYVTLMNAVGCTAEDGGEVTHFGVFDGVLEEDGIQDPGELSALRA